VSRPASDFGPPAARSLGAEPFSDLPVPVPVGVLDVVCLRPIQHVLEYEGLYGLLETLRERAPRADIVLHVRSAVRDPAPFERLPVDRVERLGAWEGRGDLAAALRRLAAGRGADASCVLIAPPAAWRRLVPGLRVAATARLDFHTAPAWSPECAQGSALFVAAVHRESPRWVAATGAPEGPLVPALIPGTGAAPRILIHQARFHLGDTLWLTPLLREVRRRFRSAELTLVAPACAREVLVGNLRVNGLHCYDPEEGEEGRRRVLAALAGGGFDAAIFAFARRHESRWLAEAAAGWGVPYRVGLEYHDPAHGDGVPWAPLTHESRFFWGSMASPRMLLHLLDPLLPPEPLEHRYRGDRRTELHVPEAARPRAAEVLEGLGIGRDPFAVICPGGASSRRWPAASFARLALLLTGHFGLHVLIEGGPGEEGLLAEVEERMKEGRAWRTVAVRSDPLDVLAVLLERARLLVANDSGAIHLAEAAAAPTLYFAQREKLCHSHPRTSACWALFDDVGNDPAAITVEQALGAVRRMVRLGLVRGLASRASR